MCNAHNHPPDCRCGFGPPYPSGQPDLVLRGFEAARWAMQVRLGPDWESFRTRLDTLMERTQFAKGTTARQKAVARLLWFGKGSVVADLFDAIATHAESEETMAAFQQLQLQQRQQARRESEVDAHDLEPFPAAEPASEPRREALSEVASAARLPRSRSHRARRTWTRAMAPEHAEPPAPATEPRYVNLCFTGEEETPVPTTRPLVAGADYRLRVDIGPLGEESIVTNAAANPVRADLLPPSAEGHWLKVVAVSRQFEVSPRGRWIFLPATGAAWSCRCKPGDSHTCQPSSRRPHILMPARAPEALGQATLRLTIYYQRSVVQSLLVTATVVRDTAEQGSNAAVVDYNLTDALSDLEAVEPRALSVMMNDDEDGSHTLVFNGVPDEAVPLHITDGQVAHALESSRAVLRRIHIQDPEPGESGDPRNRFDDDNAKSREAFITDLRELAGHGWLLWNTLWQRRATYWTRNRTRFAGDSDAIQVARKQGSSTVFPWALVYDIPIEVGAPQSNRLCRLLEEREWRTFCSASQDVPSRCPFEATHGAGVICPYGLWGFRYEIEEPPSVEIGRSPPRQIPAAPLPLDFMVALSDELDVGLRERHLRALRQQHSQFTLREFHTRNDIQTGLAQQDLEVVYFYCHGESQPLPGGAGATPRLGVGTREVIAPPDLTTWRMGWPEDHWQTTAPLVFINGCHTVDTTPQALVSFVDTFSAVLHAAGVIGTETTVHQSVANEVAETILDAFQRGETVGRALRKARTRLLRKGNLMGLTYTAYCSADLKLAASVA